MNVIITGATGYVGEGVLLDCLDNPKVDHILSISRRSTGIKHEKLEEWIIQDMMQIDNSQDRLDGYDAVFFCAGITSVGTPDDVYRRIAQDIPLHLAQAMPNKPDTSFIFVSGAGTDANGRQKWQQVKGTTEQQLLQMGFKHAFGYRPAHMTPVKGQKTKQVMVQRIFSFMLPIGRLFGMSNTLSEVARSMVNVSENGYPTPFMSPRDIRKAAQE